MAVKKDLTEQKIRSRYILPAIQKAGWNLIKLERREVLLLEL